MRVYKVASVASSLAQAEINIIVPYCHIVSLKLPTDKSGHFWANASPSN